MKAKIKVPKLVDDIDLADQSEWDDMVKGLLIDVNDSKGSDAHGWDVVYAPYLLEYIEKLEDTVALLASEIILERGHLAKSEHREAVKALFSIGFTKRDIIQIFQGELIITEDGNE